MYLLFIVVAYSYLVYHRVAAGKLENTREGVCKLESLVRVRDSLLASPVVRHSLDSSPETRQCAADDVTSSVR